MKRQSLAVIVSGLAIITGCTSNVDRDKGDNAEVDINDIARDYKDLRLITPEPVEVDAVIAVLCVAKVDAARGQAGPHAFTTIQIYMNDLAADAFSVGVTNYPEELAEYQSDITAYPVGSVIVKEKQPDLSRPMDEKGTSSGVGGMVKREAGFDPDHGDWEYFYFDTPDNIETGRIASCVQCHKRAKTTDYVFGSWHTPATELESGYE